MTVFRHIPEPNCISAALIAPVAARYGLAANGSVTLTLRGDTSRTLPHATHPQFLRQAARVSVAIQEALRVWLPYLWFTSFDRFDDFDNAATLVAYSALRPYTPKTKFSYVFDVLDDDTPRAVMHSLKRNLPAKLAAIEPMLAAAGYPQSAAFAPRRAERFWAVYRRKPQLMHALFVAERDLVEQSLSRRDPVLIERRLRRLYLSKDFTFLDPLLDLEFERALGGEIQAEISSVPPALDRHEDNSDFARLGAAFDARDARSGYQKGCGHEESHFFGVGPGLATNDSRQVLEVESGRR
ncbi:MAG: hypothetical protein SFV18_03780 [Bryobacteraceae bacterium]|nr:hypothetical protein [Bryobacteraceae bacterium]